MSRKQRLPKAAAPLVSEPKNRLCHLSTTAIKQLPIKAYAALPNFPTLSPLGSYGAVPVEITGMLSSSTQKLCSVKHCLLNKI